MSSLNTMSVYSSARATEQIAAILSWNSESGAVIYNIELEFLICYDINMKKLKELVLKVKKERNIIIDSHISHLLPKKEVDICIIITCSDLKKLERRLKKRGYSKQKIRENLDAEIFQVCLMEAKERKLKMVVVDSSLKYDKDKLLHKIHKSL